MKSKKKTPKTKNEETKQKQTHKEQIDGCQMGGGLGDWVKKVKGLRSMNCWSQNSHGDVKCGIGNVVSNTVTATHGARWVLDLWRDHFVNYINV